MIITDSKITVEDLIISSDKYNDYFKDGKDLFVYDSYYTNVFNKPKKFKKLKYLIENYIFNTLYVYYISINCIDGDITETNIDILLNTILSNFQNIKYSPSIDIMKTYLLKAIELNTDIPKYIISPEFITLLFVNDFKHLVEYLNSNNVDFLHYITQFINDKHCDLYKGNITFITSKKGLCNKIKQIEMCNSKLLRDVITNSNGNDNTIERSILKNKMKNKDVIIEYLLNNNNVMNRTKLELQFDLCVFNAIHTCAANKPDNIITLPDLWYCLTGDRNNLTLEQRIALSDSINFMGFNCSANYSFMDMDLYNDILKKYPDFAVEVDNYNKLFKDTKYGTKQMLLPIETYCCVVNGNFITMGIKLYKPSFLYIYSKVLNHMLYIPVDLFKMATVDSNNCNKILKTVKTIPIIYYVLRNILSKIPCNKLDGMNCIDISTLYSELDIENNYDVSIHSQSVMLNREKRDIYNTVKNIFDNLMSYKEYKIFEDVKYLKDDFGDKIIKYRKYNDKKK